MKNNTLLTAMKQETNFGLTENGALTNLSSLDAHVDFFFVGPVAKQNPADAVNLFQKAYHTDAGLALRILQWVRDVRGGAGARKAFRDCLAWLVSAYPRHAIAILSKTALIGRWDDVLVGMNGNKLVRAHTIELIRNALIVEKNGLCAKWMPRRGQYFYELQHELGMTKSAYRKLLSGLSKTVEQQLCANEWDEVNYSHVPSVAFARYRNAFKRHDLDRYTEFLGAVEKGEAKINASAIFPHDVVKDLPTNSWYGLNVNEVQRKAIDLQWKSLPNYIKNDESALVVADVSGSMAFPVSGSTTALHVCIALAMYMAERLKGPFKDHFLTFSTTPQLQALVGDSIVDRYQQLLTAQWEMSTNLQSAFNLILNTALKNKISQEDMPSTVIVLSDMEFNSCVGGSRNLDAIKAKFAAAGYEMPKLVFWNLKGRQGNSPATTNDKNVALVSGYSPAILGSIFETDAFDPINVMLKAVMVDRYAIDLT